MNCSSNSPCPCGSGKKYKRCCRPKAEGIQKLFEQLSSGQLPFTARVYSESGEVSSMEVHHASITQAGKTTTLLDEKITLTTNSTSGDKTSSSFASISIPANGLSHGTIRTAGNASVSNTASPQKIALINGKNIIRAKSSSGLFVVARKILQRDTQIEFFDFLFGVKGQSESLDSDGNKPRPHIAIYPDGNGKFIRLDGHKCEIESDMQYCSEMHQVLPQVLRIKSLDFSETVEVVFSTENTNELVLSEIRFKT